MTVNIPVELDDEAKNAYWQVQKEYRNFSDFVAAALRDKIEQVKVAEGLESLPARPGGGLPTGRPLSPAPRGRGA